MLEIRLKFNISLNVWTICVWSRKWALLAQFHSKSSLQKSFYISDDDLAFGLLHTTIHRSKKSLVSGDKKYLTNRSICANLMKITFSFTRNEKSFLRKSFNYIFLNYQVSILFIKFVFHFNLKKSCKIQETISKIWFFFNLIRNSFEGSKHFFLVLLLKLIRRANWKRLVVLFLQLN